MYDAPLDPAGVLGWVLLGVTLVALAARAVRVETRAPGERPTPARVADAALDVVTLAAVTALGVVLARIVLDGLGGGG